MNKTLLFLLIALPLGLFAQKDIAPSDSFIVTGQVEQEKTISMEDLQKMPSLIIGDLSITNHNGEPRNTAKEMKGLLLKDLLSDVVFKCESPKYLSEFYFTLIATDGYKVVYSWNEIYNSATGDNIYIVTEKEGKNIAEMKDKILSVCTSDLRTGRRHVKGLSQIVVSRVE